MGPDRFRSDGPQRAIRLTVRRGSAWLAVESLLATALALYLALRLEMSSVWAVLPLALLLLQRRPLEKYGLDLRFTPPSLGVHLAVGAAGLALYAIGYFVVARFLLARAVTPRLPADIGKLLFRELLVVAIPEEIFFRGYVQTNLNRIFGRARKLFGAEVGPGLLAQAVLFAFCHLASGDWTRLRVFFFALLAGWLRERSGSILAPSVYHAVANGWVAVLSAGPR